MKTIDLKKYILDNNKILDILNDLDIDNIKEHQNEFRCGKSNGLRIKKNESISITDFGEDVKSGDIFTVVMDYKNISFPRANKYLHDFLGLKFTFTGKDEVVKKGKSPLDIFMKINTYDENNNKVDIFKFDLYAQFDNFLYKEWFLEGISHRAQSTFQIMYDFNRHRIIIPHRYWCGESNDYLGVIGRTTMENYELLDIAKYLKILPSKVVMNKANNLYGLQENYKAIQKNKYLVVYEAEKSVLKRYSLYDETGVALCCHSMSQEQISILMSLDVEIVIALDEGIDIFYIYEMCDNFFRKRIVSYIDNNSKMLNKKESPADMNNANYNELFNNRIKYDEKEHDKYLKLKEER